MQKVEDYRSHAEDCRIIARRARLPVERENLLNIARMWDNLASFRAEQIARQQRVGECAKLLRHLADNGAP
jgi:uncharacterized protein Yka (UPF0111/DUF47 family)